jgi:2-methylisocitrate lyase-like PEP mutase family enzyme
VTADELLGHAAALAAAVDVPVSVDSERCYDDVEGFVDELAATGVAGFSIEDYDPGTGAIDPVDVAARRVAHAAEAGRRHGLVLMARAENHLYGRDDIDDTLVRLRAFREAGADVVYAPGVKDDATIALLVAGVDAPLNVLLWPGGPDAAALEQLGVRRVSVGGALAYVAYAAALDEYADIASGGHGSRRRLDRDERTRLG